MIRKWYLLGIEIILCHNHKVTFSILELTFRALALRRSESICSDEGITLEMSASESLYGGQFTLSKPNYLVILPPTQHHSFFRNLPPLFFILPEWLLEEDQLRCRHSFHGSSVSSYCRPL